MTVRGSYSLNSIVKCADDAVDADVTVVTKDSDTAMIESPEAKIEAFCGHYKVYHNGKLLADTTDVDEIMERWQTAHQISKTSEFIDVYCCEECTKSFTTGTGSVLDECPDCGAELTTKQLVATETGNKQ